MTLHVAINTVPHASHRYCTVGDYWDHPDGSRSVRVSEMGNPDYEFLVSIHEQIEQHLCLKRGIREADITAFDVEWEKTRPTLKLDENGVGDFALVHNITEPGHDPLAPYHKEHVFAEKIERQLAEELGVDWKEYSKTVDAL